jgi:uncharacterized protein (TIGR00730 family)
MKRVCVFCGSQFGASAEYAALAARLGTALARRRLGLVYGGASVGLMGIVADAALAGGGEVIGVIPSSMVDKELAHGGLTRLHVVQTMHQRKALMADSSDAFLALPGGLGTLDELFEILTWAYLGIHEKPIAVVNFGGYYDGLLAWLDHSVTEAFVRPEARALVREGIDADDALDALGI